MEFAYVTFVNNNWRYIELMKSTIKSVEAFSIYPIIVYCVDIPSTQTYFTPSDKCILRFISWPEVIKNVYYFKPYVIADAIEKGLKGGYYIESDDLLTPTADKIALKVKELNEYPISPIHPNDSSISARFMHRLGVSRKTQRYIHGHVLFRDTTLPFIREWLNGCYISSGECWDESVLNCMYWKYNLTNHYLDIIDPWYEIVYSNINAIRDAVTVHGCKNPKIHSDMLELLINYAKTISTTD